MNVKVYLDHIYRYPDIDYSNYDCDNNRIEDIVSRSNHQHHQQQHQHHHHHQQLQQQSHHHQQMLVEQKKMVLHALEYGNLTKDRIDIMKNAHKNWIKEQKKKKDKNIEEEYNPYPEIFNIEKDQGQFDIGDIKFLVISPNLQWESFTKKILKVTGLTIHQIQEKGVILVSDRWISDCISVRKIINHEPFTIPYDNNDDNNNENNHNELTCKKRKIEKNQDSDDDKESSTLVDRKDLLIENLKKMINFYHKSGRKHDEFRDKCYNKAKVIAENTTGPINHKTFLRIFDFDTAIIKKSDSSLTTLIKEVILTGKSKAVDGISDNKNQDAIINLRKVWGVGQAKAKTLMEQGIMTTEELRQAHNNGKVALNKRMVTGLRYFEDFQLRMSRTEVEEIFDIIMRVADTIVPNVQGCLCGSYRRGKVDCGDIDILFFPPEGHHNMKQFFIHELTDKLDKEGYLLDHIGKYKLKKSSSPQSDQEDDSMMNYRDGIIDCNCTGNYMGVFKLKKEGSLARRFDLKSYPAISKAVATLHFTGSGFFNRSIRLFVDRIGGHLSDNSLRFNVKRNVKTNEYISGSGEFQYNLHTEEDIFRRLKLPYYPPSARKQELTLKDSRKYKNWKQLEFNDDEKVVVNKNDNDSNRDNDNNKDNFIDYDDYNSNDDINESDIDEYDDDENDYKD